MDNTTNTTPVTLESIAQKPATNKANAMMRAFNTGMAVFDGIVLGVKVMKKFRKIFGRKR